MASEYVSSSRFVHRDQTFELEDSSLHHMEERTDGQTSTHTLKWTVPNYCTQLLNKVSYVCHQIRIGKRYHRLRILKYDTRIQVGGVSQPEKLIYLLVGVTPALSDPTKASFALLAGRDCEILPVNGLKNVLRHLPYRDCFVEFMDTQAMGSNDKPHLGILCRFTVPVSLSVDLLKHERVILDLEKLLQDTETSDVTFIVEDHEFKAHRTILIARSSVFRAMFRHHTVTSDRKVTVSSSHHCIHHQGTISCDNDCANHQDCNCEAITEGTISSSHHCIHHPDHEGTISCDNDCTNHQDCNHEAISGGTIPSSNRDIMRHQDSRRHLVGTEVKASTYHQDSKGQHETTAGALSSDHHQATKNTQNTVLSDSNHNHNSMNHETITCTEVTFDYRKQNTSTNCSTTKKTVDASTQCNDTLLLDSETENLNSCTSIVDADASPNESSFCNDASITRSSISDIDSTRSQVFHRPNIEVTKPDITRSQISHYTSNRTISITDSDVTRCPVLQDITNTAVFHQPSHQNIDITRSSVLHQPSQQNNTTRCPVSLQPSHQHIDATRCPVSLQPSQQNNTTRCPASLQPSQQNNTTRCPVSFQPSQQNHTTRCPVSILPTQHIDTTRSHNNQANLTVTIVDTDAETFAAFLNYLYTGRLRSLSPGLAQDLLTLADKYDIQDLKEEVSDFLLSNLSVDCVLRTLVLADRHREVKLRDQAVTFVAGNLKQVMKRQEWTEFRKQIDLVDGVLRRIAGLSV